jgi:hypothetical protein
MKSWKLRDMRIYQGLCTKCGCVLDKNSVRIKRERCTRCSLTAARSQRLRREREREVQKKGAELAKIISLEQKKREIQEERLRLGLPISQSFYPVVPNMHTEEHF